LSASLRRRTEGTNKKKKIPKYFKEGKIKKINDKNNIINDIYFSKEEIIFPSC